MNTKVNSSLEGVYASHHKERRKPFFILQGETRGNFLKQNVGQGKKVLDIGCRDGALTSYYAKGNSVLGVDIDTEALARAKETLSIDTMQMDLNGEWSTPKNHFDVVVAAEVLEHVYYPDTILKKIYISLKPGGILLGSIPNAFSLKNRLRYLRGTKKHTPLSDPTHINHFSRKEFESLLDQQFSEWEIVPLGRFTVLEKVFPGLFSFMMMFKAKK